MRFSIIVPVYNVQEYLNRCMESLIGQKFEKEEYEILLIDDGSKDSSGEICDSWAQKQENVKVIHKVNGGLSSARNAGLEAAVGDYVLFVDSDDYADERMCADLEQLIEQYHHPDVVHYDGWREYGRRVSSIWLKTDSKSVLYSGAGFLKKRYQETNMNVEAWLYCYRREFLENHDLHFQEGILHEDVEFTPRVILQAESVVEFPKQLYHYIIRENSISTKKDKTKNIQDLTDTLRKLDHLADQQENEVRIWIKNGILNSYLNMIYQFRMDQKPYRSMVDKAFLRGKAATGYNRMRVCLCSLSVRLYCQINEFSKNRKQKI